MIRLHFLFCFFISLLALGLSSCATISPQQLPPENADISWPTRMQSLSQIENWDLTAMFAMRTKENAESATLNWQQNKQSFTILLFGPLGANTFKLSGTPGHIELVNPHGDKFFASTPEALLVHETGWHLPVSSLYYWIRGLPVPGVPATKQFDAYHHLLQLKQQGWTIQFLHYTNTAHGDLPSKILLEHPPLSIKLIISEWHSL